MTDITGFLTARWDEEEAIARGADGELEPWDVSDAGNVTAYDKRLIASVWIQNARHIAYWDPAHVLANAAAKRAILAHETAPVRVKQGSPVAVHTSEGNMYWDLEQLYPLTEDQKAAWWEEWTEPITDTPILRLLAQPYAAHPDYDPDWRTHP